MDLLIDLWLPILLSGVAVFFLSFTMWMLMPHHKSDWKKVPDEDKLAEALGDSGHGMYMFPFGFEDDKWKDPEWIKKRDAGASGTIIIVPRGPCSMGTSLAKSFVFNVVISIITAYVATIAFQAGAAGMDVFRMTATVAFLGYTGALIWDLIWARRPAIAVFKNVFDGLVYGLATGAIFMAFWPAAAG